MPKRVGGTRVVRGHELDVATDDARVVHLRVQSHADDDVDSAGAEARGVDKATHALLRQQLHGDGLQHVAEHELGDVGQVLQAVKRRGTASDEHLL